VCLLYIVEYVVNHVVNYVINHVVDYVVNHMVNQQNRGIFLGRGRVAARGLYRWRVSH
jgi:hypothetical protein